MLVMKIVVTTAMLTVDRVVVCAEKILIGRVVTSTILT